MKFTGTKSNDVIVGTTRDDTFLMTQGGHDMVTGKGGDDTFVFGAAFNANDQINGGYGNDVLKLDGDYSATHAVTFVPTTTINLETIMLAGRHSYSLTTNDATVAAGKTLTVNAIRLGSNDSLQFNGSNETDGNFVIYGGKGDDVLRGGGGDNVFHLGQGGNDTVIGGAYATDTFYFGDSLADGDRIHGGFVSTIVLNGNATVDFVAHKGGVQLNGGSHVTLQLEGNHDYDLTFNGHATETIGDLTVDGSAVGSSNSVIADGRGGSLSTTLIGGAVDDRLDGGYNAGFRNDSPSTLIGGGGADTLIDQGEGNVTFVYNAASDSTSLGFDTVSGFGAGFDASPDFLKLPGSPSITVDSTIHSGRLDSSTFDADIQNAVGAIANDHAVVFIPGSGDESNTSGGGIAFLIVNIDGAAGYQAGSDLVMKMSAGGGVMHDSNFI